MADSHHVEEGADLMFGRKLSRQLQDARGFSVHRRDIMVRDDGDLVRIPQPHAQFAQHRRPATRPRTVVRKGQIDLSRHQLAGRNPVHAGRPGDDLFNERGAPTHAFSR
nr:hypothetical protein [Enterobacter roggenkampii]